MRLQLSFSLCVIAALPVIASAQQGSILYVASTGNDSGNGGPGRPFATIQRAIYAAVSPSVVIVAEGRYSGPGNVDLDFAGRAIVVQSRNPSDPNCVRATIIDAEGKSVIAHFTHGEGSATTLDGFTLLAGDQTQLVRGLPGYFEIASDAHPTTRNLRIPSAASELLASRPRMMPRPAWSGVPIDTRAWNGNDPFVQPAAATDYYGSGDVDGDGLVTVADLQLVEQMASGQLASTATADVDGNGIVNSGDVTLITAALGGGTLPAWWNQLITKDQRNAWIDNFLTLDPTNRHPYSFWFQCLNFATQLYLDAGLYRSDLLGKIYDGGRSRFNLPLYAVTVSGNAFGHAIDAILVGDNPLSFDDWRFLEPQNDGDVHPGMWDMPFGVVISIEVPDDITSSGYSINSDGIKVVFSLDDTGRWSLTSRSANLVISRQVQPSNTPDNRSDLWNPVAMPANNGILLFNEQRADLSRIDDIHVTNLPFVDPPAATSLVNDGAYARLLHVTQGPDGRIHVLWIGGSGFSPGLFYGVFDPATHSLKTTSRITAETREIHSGRIVVTPDGQIHAFWFASPSNVQADYTTGVYWSQLSGSAWAAEQNIGPVAGYTVDWGDWHLLDPFRSVFDAVVRPDGTILVVWCDRGNNFGITVRQRLYAASWGDPSTIDVTSFQGGGVNLVCDSHGTVHLAYWLGGFPNPYAQEDSWSNISHRTLTGTTWSSPDTIDSGGQAASPYLLPTNGAVYAVWARNTGSQIVPVLKRYLGSEWGTEQVFSVRPGADAYYPSASVLADGRLIVVWSSRSPDRATVETAYAKVNRTSVTTNPAGLTVFVDGTPYMAPQSFDWAAGSNHTVNVATVQGGAGTRRVFAGWSDTGAQSHAIAVPTSSATYTANYTIQYLLTAAPFPAGSGVINVSPTSPDGYYTSGAAVLLTAVPTASYGFVGFSGGLTGAANPQYLTMSTPCDVTGTFAAAAPTLTISETHATYFMPLQRGATYIVIVSNAASAPSSSGEVRVKENLPLELTLVSMSGTGWTCQYADAACTRTDPLAGGESYPPITVIVNIADNAPGTTTNQVSVSGGGSATATASDPTTIAFASACDVSQDGRTDLLDIQLLINEALGTIPAVDDLNQDGFVNVQDVMKVMNAALRLGCSAL